MPPKPRKKPTRAKGLGITDDAYTALLAAQGGHCALCPNTPKTRRLHVDHDHATGEVRGLLCYQCNKRLWKGSTRAWLLRAADYVEPRDDAMTRRAALIARIPGDTPTPAQAAALAYSRNSARTPRATR